MFMFSLFSSSEEAPKKAAPKRKTAEKAPKETKAKRQKQEKEKEKEEEKEKGKAKGKGKEKEAEVAKEAAEEFRIPVEFNVQVADVLTLGSGEVGQLGLQRIFFVSKE